MNLDALPHGIIHALLFTPLFLYAIIRVKTLPGIIFFTIVSAYTVAISQNVAPLYQEQTITLWLSQFIAVALFCLGIILAHFLATKAYDHIKDSRKPAYSIGEDGETIDVIMPSPREPFKLFFISAAVLIGIIACIAISLWPQTYIMVDVQNDSTPLSAYRPALCRELVPNTVVIVDNIYFDYNGVDGYVPLTFRLMFFDRPNEATDKIGYIRWVVTPRKMVPHNDTIRALTQRQVPLSQYQNL